MINFSGKSVAVLGLMDPGAAAIQLAQRKGAQVYAYGVATDKELSALLKKIDKASCRINTEDIATKELLDKDMILLTPGGGGERYAKAVDEARSQGLPVYTDMEIAASFLNCPIIAVTGSNGKSSTVHILKTLLEKSGKKIRAAGGHYEEFADLLIKPESIDYAIFEVSSSRLEQAEHFHPYISILMNIYPGHAERYKTIQEYAAIKTRIYKEQTPQDFSIIQLSPLLDDIMIKNPCSAQVYRFSYGNFTDLGASFKPRTNEVFFRDKDGRETVYDYSTPRLMGGHNTENFLAALCAAKLCGVGDDTVKQVISTLQPLPHRMEVIKKVAGVTFIDDAQSCNVTATQAGLFSLPNDSVILIAGGLIGNGQIYKELRSNIQPKVKVLILYGTLRKVLFEKWGDLAETYLVDSLEDGVKLACQKAGEKDIVLYSPACRPESNVHRSAKHRGELFHKAVDQFSKHMKSKAATGRILGRI